MLFHYIRRQIDQLAFKDKDIAGHSIRPGGRVAGKVDAYANGHIRGWIYDARKPDAPVKLRLFVNGNRVADFLSNIYREDIAKLTRRNGTYGFEVDVSRYFEGGGSVLSLKIEIVDDRKYTLGPVLVAFDSSNAAAVRSASPRLESGDTHAMTLDQRFQHIFNHITATFEVTRAQLNQVQGQISGVGLSSAAAGSPVPIKQSKLMGIGAYRDEIVDEGFEENLMAARIRSRVEVHAQS